MKRLLLAASALLFAWRAEAQPIQWQPVGPPGHPPVLALVKANGNFALGFRPPASIYASVAGGGVLRSPTSGLTWDPSGSGLEGHDAVTLAVSQVPLQGVDATRYDTTVYAGTADGGVFRLGPDDPTLPEAPSWVAVNTGLTSLDVRTLTTSGDGVTSVTGPLPLLFAGTAGGLFASKDGGDTWSPKTAGLPSGADRAITALASDPSAPSTLYAGTSGGLFKSSDSGETWSKLDTGSTFILSVSAITVDPLSSSRVYAAGFKTFACSPFCLPIAFMPVAVRSIDGGASWAPMDSLSGVFVRALGATSTFPSRVFAGTSGNGVFESSDAGATWAMSNNGLGSASVSSLAIDPVLPSFLFAGTTQGVSRAKLGQLAVACAPDAGTACFDGRRFSAVLAWRLATGGVAYGQAVPITDKTGAFWFFDPSNLELVVKVLDGRSVNGKFWVFYGSLTNVEFTLFVRDTLTGAVKTYFNPQGQLASVADISAF